MKSLCLYATLLLILGPAAGAFGQADEATGKPSGLPDEDERVARRLLDTAKSLMEAQQKDRAVKMLETLIEQHPESFQRYEAYLELGKYYLDEYKQTEAIGYFRRLKELAKGKDKGELTGDRLDFYLEALYNTGVAHFQLKQYAAAFPVLRQITRNYPNTVWSNQAYYYIGMCHFAQGNWKQAIRDLSLVGVFIDTTSETASYIEAGRRLYIKLEDADLPVRHRLGKETTVTLESGKGDVETIEAVPLSSRNNIFLASAPTEIASPDKEDGTLQVVGGDTVTVRYFDANTKEGEHNILREKKVTVVSSGSVSFTVGTFEDPAPAAFLNEPVFVLLVDADLDTSPKADTVVVEVESRYKSEQLTAEFDPDQIGRELEEPYKTRDKVTLTLAELGEGKAIHSGRFGGEVWLTRYDASQTVNTNDEKLACAMGDEVLVTYVDRLHINGESPREATAKVEVAGELDTDAKPIQDLVTDAKMKAEKGLVEATANLMLARIFRSMGLLEGAAEKADEGLDRIDPIIMERRPIPTEYKERAFKLKWELYIQKEDYASAIQTCRVFNEMFPESRFVDQALLDIGTIHFENKDFKKAMGVFKQILALEKSLVKAEAQYMIARSIEEQAREAARMEGVAKTDFRIPEEAIKQYKLCAEQYPDSPRAGESLSKLVTYYIDSREYAQADDLMRQVFEDYPDAEFLDQMLLHWTIVALRLGEIEKAHEKCTRLLIEYPNSKYAPQAREKLLPIIEQQMNRGSEEAAG